MANLNNKKYQYIQIGIASPDEIRSWAYRKEDGFYGEVKKHETINYRTLKPERDGLFCEVIFGPMKDRQCACGRSRKNVNGEHHICERCGVEITDSKVRREKMGFINLQAPVVHTWYLRNTPSKIAILLDMKTKDVEDIVYLAAYIITEVKEDYIRENATDENGLAETIHVGKILTEQEHSRYKLQYRGVYTALTGAEAIKHLLKQLDLGKIVSEIRAEIPSATKQKREKLIKRLEIAEAFYKSDNKPEWMVMDVIPVIPPDLRPMVQLDGGRFATTDLNDLYRRIINRNNRLKKQYEVHAPDLIVKNEKRMLQEAVDALIDNSKRNKKVVLDKNRALKSLSDILRGKQGRFRQNLLGKRVDYSGRSVICVGPDLKMYQCGIPREMALILFKPFIINYLRNKDEETAAQSADGLIAKNEKAGIRRAKDLIERGAPEAMEALEHVIVEHPVLLNRAPTLHRLSIQAFEPKLVEGRAIRLHPLATTPFNADFDGDQMPVHVPLSQEAQAEARLLMLASKNILAPKDGKPIVTPSQDMIIGNYYLTIEESQPGREGRAFKDINEMEHAYEEGVIDFHTRVIVPAASVGRDFVNLHEASDEEELAERTKKNEELKNKYLITTYGKTIFNTIFPSFFPYVNVPERDNMTYGTPESYFVDHGTNYKEYIKNMPLATPVKKKFLSVIISEVFREAKLAETSKTLDKMKDIGFFYSTRSGLTVSAFDIETVKDKKEILAAADEKVKKYTRLYERGLLKNEERRKNVIDVWKNATDTIQKQIKKMMADGATTNHIFLMADSGARGSASNFLQLAGMRGLMAKPNGESMEIPIKSCFSEGLSMSEFFISTHGARKGSTDTALKTAESGYLTRRLVDVSQDVIITCEDCGTDKGMYVNDLWPDKSGIIDKSANEPLVPLKDRIIGRYAAEKISYLDQKGNEVIVVDRNQFINEKTADKILKYREEFYANNFDKFPGVKIRTILTCNAPNLSNGAHGCPTPNGVCVKCYGSDLSTSLPVEKGEVVGIVAAQSIGEPGTQLTMRTFHSGGVAGDDITQGLPRIQELFEAREPKGKGIISEIKGKVTSIVHNEKDNRFEITIENKHDTKTYVTDSGKAATCHVNDLVEAGDQISEGLVHPKELLRVAPVSKVEQYILKEVEKVYRSQGVEISDKHVEIIIKQMLQKVIVLDEGDTDLLPGTFISKPEIYKEIKACFDAGKRVPIVKPVILGITRASLKADSFLSAASFQETTRVLTEAAIRGKKDTLEGLKENIIIGGLIPAGTGLVDQVDVEVDESETKYKLNQKSY